MLNLRTHYLSSTGPYIQHCFADEQIKYSFEKKKTFFLKEKTNLVNLNSKYLLILNFVCFSYLRETFPT